MQFLPKRSRDALGSSRASNIRCVAFAILAGFLATGCFEQNPGGSQQQASASRAESSTAANPQCMDNAVLLVLDHDAVAPGRNFSEKDLGCHGKRPGNRMNVAWFARNLGQETVLPAGQVGDEGWFAPTSVRIGWKSAGPAYGDGLRNYAEAGPGLGSSDGKGHTETLLEKVPALAPLRATGLARLTGRSVCAVVLARNVVMNYGPLMGDIRGDNLGRIAFHVLGLADPIGTRGHGTGLPSVRIRVLDAETVCSDPLAAYVEAPLPESPTQPMDTDVPACAVQRELINEDWNGFDTSIWRGDGDQMTSGGLFFARPGAFSTAADWVPNCPITIDSNTGIRFTNRIQLLAPTQNAYVESGALFMVNAESDGAFSDYVFVNVGYMGQPGKVFVELFGASGGQDFDQFEESSIAAGPSINFAVDLWIFKDSYQVAVGGEVLDTVDLAKPLTSMALFEVGIQQNGGGLRGLIDQTTVGVMCKTVKEEVHRCRRHTERRMCFRKGKSYRSATATEPEPQQTSTRVIGHIRGRNNLIRMARVKVQGLARPPAGLLMLSKMKEIPDPTQY